MIVKVAIDLALDRLFDYEVPEAFQKKLTVGQLLSVPFGHREARGFAMEISVRGARDSSGASGSRITSHSSPALLLKPITAIIDETPFFSPQLLQLVKRVADYTASPLESVLKTALPAAVLKKNARPRELMYVEPALSVAGKITKRQQWLYDQILRLGGGWMTSLCRELKTTQTTIKELGRLGLVKVVVRAKRRDPLGHKRILPTKPLLLNEEQKKALEAIVACGARPSVVSLRSAVGTSCPTKPTLLFGITGSGKTEVYLQAIAAELAAGRGAIVMVPEIALTPQTVQRFASRFGDQVAVLHSALSDGERYDEWHRIRSGQARVVVGPRSAVWAPVANLGLVVVDEEHETSYKQDETPRYHARDVAVLRGALEGAKVVLGSATPSLESWLNVQNGKYTLVRMTKRAGAGTLPSVELVEMKDGSIFSSELLAAIQVRLERGEQTILFLNRRGYSSSMTCSGCGYVMECPACGVPYTYHRVDTCLRCHVCGGWVPVPERCPSCNLTDFDCKGVGTQRVEAALAKCFARARVLRMDADSTSRKNTHDDILSAFRRGEADILVGTQMIAKGLDFPNVTLVGVLNADSSLNQPDFRAGERTYQLLAQVSGRAGRAEKSGKVVIQTHDLSQPVIRAAARGDFSAFAESELQIRRACGFPPFTHLAVIHFRSRNLKLVGGWAEMYAASLRKCRGLEVSEAIPSALEKIDGWYRWQVVLRAAQASTLVQAWRWIHAVRPEPSELRVGVDVDACNLL